MCSTDYTEADEPAPDGFFFLAYLCNSTSCWYIVYSHALKELQQYAVQLYRKSSVISKSGQSTTLGLGVPDSSKTLGPSAKGSDNIVRVRVWT